MAMELKHGDWAEPRYNVLTDEYRLWDPGTRKVVAVGDVLRMTPCGDEFLLKNGLLEVPAMACFFCGRITVEVEGVKENSILVRVISVSDDARCLLRKDKPFMGESFWVHKMDASEWFCSFHSTPLRCECLGRKKCNEHNPHREPYRFRMDSLGNEPVPFTRKKKKRKQWM